MSTSHIHEEVYSLGYQAGYAAGDEEKRRLIEYIAELHAQRDARPTLDQLNAWKERCGEKDAAICALQQELDAVRRELDFARRQLRQCQDALLRLQQRLEQTTKNAPE